MRRATLRRAIAAAACASAVAGPALAQLLAVNAAGPATCTGVRARSDGWQTVLAPTSFADPGVLAYAVAPAAPRLIYATDGHLVARSTNGGCTWADVLDRDTLVSTDLVHVDIDRVVDLDVAAGSGQRVYAVVEADVSGVRRTDVVVSDDGGASWRAPGLGLPVLGGSAALSVAPAAPDTAYLAIDTTAAPGLPTTAALGGPAVYSTANGGLTWTRRTSPVEIAPVDAVVADPADPSRIIGRGPRGVVVSDDAGATFGRATGATLRMADLAVGTRPRGTAVVAAVADASELRRSANGGRTWTATRIPAPAHSVAVLDGADLAAVAADGAVLLLVGDDLRDVSPTGGPAGALSLRTGPDGPALFALGEGAILRRSLATRSALPRVELHAAPANAPGVASLVPRSLELALPVGGSRVVPYTLDLPAEPTPLDVFFLVDTTGSMGPAIAGLREGLAQIVNDLAASQISAQFGVGEFKDYPESPWGSAGDTPYRLARAIGPVDEALERAIEGLQASGGGDRAEAALTGLLQSATGAGQRGAPAHYIEPGRSAGFRPGSLRVIVTVTDVPFHREAGHPGPSFTQTVEALRSRDVRQVGLAVNGGGRDDLAEMATATRAFAPATGLDCNGDGRRDLAPGAPLVCDVGDTALLGLEDNEVLKVLRPRISIAPAVIGLLRSVRDEAAVELQALRPDISEVLGIARVGRVDGKRAQRLHFLVRYTCPADGKTDNAPAPLRAVRRDAVLAEASALLRCIPAFSPAPSEELLPPRALPPLAALLLLPPPPPPPAPVTQAQPNPNTNSNPNPQAQPNGQPAMAAAERPEHEVAVVDTRGRAEGTEELAMSRRSRRDEDTGAALAIAAVVVCGAASAGFMRSRAAQPACANADDPGL
ncbi:MAG TPA: VWA domain-containing protein [Mycobacteriales bacterium]|nr:VWA domain-containing protein [Mycobacteriales bacterium]